MKPFFYHLLVCSLLPLSAKVIEAKEQQQQPFSLYSFDKSLPNEDLAYSAKLENELTEITSQLFEPTAIKTSCSSCISLLQALKRMSRMSEVFFINSLIKICKKSEKVDDEVCDGVIREQAPIIRQVLPTLDISGRDGHLMCAAVINSCPYPEVDHWNVTFPKPKPTKWRKPLSSGHNMTILQLSDWHIDPEYQEGTETFCDKPICCRTAYTDFGNVTKSSSKWGEYSCDTSLDLIKSMLNYIPTVEPNISFGILTGDVPPHEVWHTLPPLKTQLIQDESYRLLHQYFDSPFLINSMLYPAVGNHESAPTNNFPLSASSTPSTDVRNSHSNHHHNHTLSWLYHSLSESWKGWLTHKSQQQSVKNNMGSYVVRPVPGLKLISLNTNFCYVLNWWLYQQPTHRDPNGVLDWLITELQDSEDQGSERVWIVGHIAPGDNTCLHDYANYYYQIVDRYSHIIAAQFFGHTHRDEMTIFYSKDSKQMAENAISVGYVAPSITPFLNLNPGFRVYKIDTGTFEVIDSITYIANLDQASTWKDEDGPNWHKEYSAREAYASAQAKLSSPMAPLSPAWWHQVTEDMEDPTMDTFDKYYHYRSKLSPVPDYELCLENEECKKKVICGIRAGKSELRCDFDPDYFPGLLSLQSKETAEQLIATQQGFASLQLQTEESGCGLRLMGHRH
ncbi:Metallo-dependent phosphatase-like protein [Mycotypha africana]|uniref:Metallo-dependent phosphatase-like protein n=1 Tax=Mycotypha africana TaxID=64632 RepID=UPI002300BB6D|nr:Metallo-dependent phosphatase-like protein [Mycotypha africana]KAI8991188.1 Metallo-dependent phosphatase-like protein [Mycotypha africana]